MRSSSLRLALLSGLLFLAMAASHAQAQTTREVPNATVAAMRAEPLATPPSGSTQADVTIVEYFDYNCPVCREIDPQLRKLVATDPKVRIIHKDWPIFGDGSVYATYCSFAAARAGKYRQAHEALIGSKDDLESQDDVRKVLRAAGFDVTQLDADIARHKSEYSAVIARNAQETKALGLTGTPGLVVGNQLMLAGVDSARLVQLVAQARKSAHPH